VPIALKSGSLTLLEPSGHVQACNGIDLPLHIKMLLEMALRRASYLTNTFLRVLSLIEDSGLRGCDTALLGKWLRPFRRNASSLTVEDDGDMFL